MRLARGRVAAGIAAAVLLMGCGDDESASPATTVAPATTTTLSQTELDRQKAQRIVLTAADLPGYTAEPPDPVEGSDRLEEEAAPCFNNNRLIVRVGQPSDQRGASADFRKGDGVSVGSAVTFAETEDEARAALTDIGAASFPACFSRVLTADLQGTPGVSNVSATTTRLPALAVGDQSVGYRSVVKARSNGTAVTINLDFTFIRTGRAVAVLDDNSLGTPFPASERGRLATALAGRMAAP